MSRSRRLDHVRLAHRRDRISPPNAHAHATMSWRRLALATPLVLATSCMVGPNYSTPKSDVAPQWIPSPAASSTTLNATDAYWWKLFQDPVLDGLVESAFQNNLTLQIAGVRVLAARAALNKSIGNLFPQQQGLSGA